MALKVLNGINVMEANVLQTLDGTPPPMDFNSDFNVSEIAQPQVNHNMNADLGFLNKGYSI